MEQLHRFEESLLSVISVEQVYVCMQEMYYFKPMLDMDDSTLDALTLSVFNTYYNIFFLNICNKVFKENKFFVSLNEFCWIHKSRICVGPLKERVKELAQQPYSLPGNDMLDSILSFQENILYDSTLIHKLLHDSKHFIYDDETDFYETLYDDYMERSHFDLEFQTLVNTYYNTYYILKKPNAQRAFLHAMEYSVFNIHPKFNHHVKECMAVQTIEKVYRSHVLKKRLPVVANKARLKDEIEYRPFTGIKYFEALSFFENKEWEN
jgi:hypothetical protein